MSFFDLIVSSITDALVVDDKVSYNSWVNTMVEKIDAINYHLQLCINSERLSERQSLFKEVQSNLLNLQPELEIEAFSGESRSLAKVQQVRLAFLGCWQHLHHLLEKIDEFSSSVLILEVIWRMMIRSEFDPEFLILDANDISWCTADVMQAFRVYRRLLMNTQVHISSKLAESVPLTLSNSVSYKLELPIIYSKIISVNFFRLPAQVGRPIVDAMKSKSSHASYDIRGFEYHPPTQSNSNANDLANSSGKKTETALAKEAALAKDARQTTTRRMAYATRHANVEATQRMSHPGADAKRAQKSQAISNKDKSSSSDSSSIDDETDSNVTTTSASTTAVPSTPIPIKSGTQPIGIPGNANPAPLSTSFKNAMGGQQAPTTGNRKVSYQQMQLQKRQQQQQQPHRPSQTNRLSRGSSSAMAIPSASRPALPSLSTIMSQSPTRMRGFSSPDLPLNVARIAQVNNTNHSQLQSAQESAVDSPLASPRTERESEADEVSLGERALETPPMSFGSNTLSLTSSDPELKSSPRGLAMSPRDITLEESYPDRAAIHLQENSSTEVPPLDAGEAGLGEIRDKTEDLSLSPSSPREKRDSLLNLDDATEDAANAIDFIIEHGASDSHVKDENADKIVNPASPRGATTDAHQQVTVASVLRPVEPCNYDDLPATVKKVCLVPLSIERAHEESLSSRTVSLTKNFVNYKTYQPRVFGWKRLHSSVMKDTNAGTGNSPLEQYQHWTVWFQSRSIIHLFTIREWVDYVTSQLKKPRISIQSGASVAKILPPNQIIDWKLVPGYEEFIESFLDILKHSDKLTRSLQSTCFQMLRCEPKLLNYYMRFLFTRVPATDISGITECVTRIQEFFQEMIKHEMILPDDFDISFFCNVFSVIINLDHFQLLSKVLNFFFMASCCFHGTNRRVFYGDFILRTYFFRLFLHWDEVTRNYFHEFLLSQMLRFKFTRLTGASVPELLNTNLSGKNKGALGWNMKLSENEVAIDLALFGKLLCYLQIIKESVDSPDAELLGFDNSLRIYSSRALSEFSFFLEKIEDCDAHWRMVPLLLLDPHFRSNGQRRPPTKYF